MHGLSNFSSCGCSTNVYYVLERIYREINESIRYVYTPSHKGVMFLILYFIFWRESEFLKTLA